MLTLVSGGGGFASRTAWLQITFTLTHRVQAFTCMFTYVHTHTHTVLGETGVCVGTMNDYQFPIKSDLDLTVLNDPGHSTITAA